MLEHSLAVLHQQGDGRLLGRGRQHLLLLQLSPLGLVTSVLEPDFHLRLRQLEGARQVRALGPRQVALVAEAAFQLVHLAVRERGSRPLPAGLL